MLTPGSGMPRALRAASVAGLAALLAALGHRLGGMPLAGPALLLALGAVTPLAWAITGRRLGTRALTAALGAGQLLAHTAFVVADGARASLATPTASTPTATMGERAGHAHHPMATGPGGPDLGLDARMLLAHLLATLALAALLARGEAVLWRVWERLRPRLPDPAALLFPPPLAGPGCRPAAAPAGLATSARCTRGPPAAVR